MSIQTPERPDIPKPKRSWLNVWTHVVVVLVILGLIGIALFRPPMFSRMADQAAPVEMAESVTVPEAAAPEAPTPAPAPQAQMPIPAPVEQAPVPAPAPSPAPVQPGQNQGMAVPDTIQMPETAAPDLAEDMPMEEPMVVEEALADDFQDLEPAAGPASDDGLEIVRVFYGTDRRNEGDEIRPIFEGVRGRALTLGSVDVSVPKPLMHEVGAVERPWNYSFLGFSISGREDPDRHFIIQQIAVLDRESFLAQIRAAVDASEGFEDQALVFVHGFNVDFEAAAYRTAQIAYDLDFDGAPIFYSWPSRGAIGDYEYDQNSARQARRYLGDFLEMVRAESGAETIHLIAHSMGNDPLMEVLAQIADRHEGEGPLFNQVILAAPDIDIDVFGELAERVTSVSEGITLYASSADKALIASRAYARGVPRAGDIPENGPIILPGIDTIDITSVGAEMLSLNHSEYAENQELLDDIGRLLRTGLRPPKQRMPILNAIDLGGSVYWQFP